MSAGHDHPGGHGCADTHRLLCELFNPETPAQRRAEIKEDITSCPECLAVAQSESDVRAIVRDCCASTRAPEPLRQRIDVHGRAAGVHRCEGAQREAVAHLRAGKRHVAALGAEAQRGITAAGGADHRVRLLDRVPDLEVGLLRRQAQLLHARPDLRVEIIRGKATGDRAVAKALDFVRQIRKTPIVVNDARFFYANRCIIPYINEGVRMVGEGVNPTLIENAAKMMGMPLGPLQLIDETSIDLGVKIAKATKAALGGEYVDTEVDDVLFWMADQGRMGRKSKSGFYAYDEAGKRQDLWEGLDAQFPRAEGQPDLTEVQQRLMFVQALEAVRALEQGVLTVIREGDVGAILGWGFAPWSGGPFGWLDILGAARAVEVTVLGMDHTLPKMRAHISICVSYPSPTERHAHGRRSPCIA